MVTVLIYGDGGAEFLGTMITMYRPVTPAKAGVQSRRQSRLKNHLDARFALKDME